MQKYTYIENSKRQNKLHSNHYLFTHAILIE